MKAKAEVTAVCYKVCIDEYKVNVCDLDSNVFDHTDGFDPFEILKSVDYIDMIEYNGHLGNYVYFRALYNEARDEFLKVLDDVLTRAYTEMINNIWVRSYHDGSQTLWEVRYTNDVDVTYEGWKRWSDVKDCCYPQKPGVYCFSCGKYELIRG